MQDSNKEREVCFAKLASKLGLHLVAGIVSQLGSILGCMTTVKTKDFVAIQILGVLAESGRLWE